jgi:hypothetical protein
MGVGEPAKFPTDEGSCRHVCGLRPACLATYLMPIKTRIGTELNAEGVDYRALCVRFLCGVV